MRKNRWLSSLYVWLVMVFLYAPIAVLIIFSFNDSKSRNTWTGFTLDWYVELFHDRVIILFLYCLINHLSTDKSQQNECYPVVNACDVLLKADAQHIADKRHERLKSSEIKTDCQRLLSVYLCHSKSLADGYCEGVH